MWSTAMAKVYPMNLYLPDRRDVHVSRRWTCGSEKIGMRVLCYSRLPGMDFYGCGGYSGGTCPGSTDECEAICYAKRIDGDIKDIYRINSATSDVPEVPSEATLVRWHVSGDFDSVAYIENVTARVAERPDVLFWAYTRSWRVPELLEALERLRALPNMQLFASVDPSMTELPPEGWRRAWIWRDKPSTWLREQRLRLYTSHNAVVEADGTPAYICPEETGRRRNCEECGYCFAGQKHDVVFLEH